MKKPLVSKVIVGAIEKGISIPPIRSNNSNSLDKKYPLPLEKMEVNDCIRLNLTLSKEDNGKVQQNIYQAILRKRKICPEITTYKFAVRQLSKADKKVTLGIWRIR